MLLYAPPIPATGHLPGLWGAPVPVPSLLRGAECVSVLSGVSLLFKRGTGCTLSLSLYVCLSVCLCVCVRSPESN
jgi:hypothetical protein